MELIQIKEPDPLCPSCEKGFLQLGISRRSPNESENRCGMYRYRECRVCGSRFTDDEKELKARGLIK